MTLVERIFADFYRKPFIIQKNPSNSHHPWRISNSMERKFCGSIVHNSL